MEPSNEPEPSVLSSYEILAVQFNENALRYY